MLKLSKFVFLLFFIPNLISMTNNFDKIKIKVKMDINVKFKLSFVYLNYLDKDNKIKRLPKIYSSDSLNKKIRIDTVFNIPNKNLNSDKIALYLIILSDEQDGFGYSYVSLDTFLITNATVSYYKKLELRDFEKNSIIE